MGPEIIVTRTETVPVDTLTTYCRNDRIGDVGLISDSITALGFFRAIVVNERECERCGEARHVLAGNHTLAALTGLGGTEILANFVDVDYDTAERIRIVDNRANDVAHYDDPLRIQNLVELSASEFGLTGTGYDEDDVAVLMRDLAGGLDAFPDVEGDTDYRCPSCGYEWTGNPK